MQVLERDYKAFDIDDEAWRAPKPFGISGCFRLKDEAEFMCAAVESHLPYLDEAVLAVQPSQDNTVELAYLLQRTHPDKVRVVEYPVSPHFIDHPDFHTDAENSIHSFVYLSNWALAQCRYSWIAKTEGDVIALSSFGRVVQTVKMYPDRRALYGRVILNVAGAARDCISWENPRNGGWDECVIPNHPDFHFIRRDKWEVMVHPGDIQTVCMGWSALHMKRCKAEFLPGTFNGERYVEWTRESVARACQTYNQTRGAYPGNDGDALGQGDYLYEQTNVTDAR